MSRTPERRKTGNIQHWFFSHPQFSARSRGRPRLPEIQRFLQDLWPVGTEYFSTLNPFFLLENVDLDDLSGQPVWLSRDGLVPLLWFFKMNPRPQGFKSKILIQEDFSPYVPTEWRRHFGTYRVVSFTSENARKKTRLILAGLAMDSYCSLTRLDAQLARIREFLSPEQLKERKIMAFVPQRWDTFVTEPQLEYHTHYVLKLAQALGADITPLSWKQFEGLLSLQDADFVEFNEQYLCADSYLTHWPLSKGATLLDPAAQIDPSRAKESGQISEGEALFHLSPHHGVVVKPELRGQYLTPANPKSMTQKDEYLLRIQEAMRSETNRRFPWPTWFTTWTRAVLPQAAAGKAPARHRTLPKPKRR